MDETLGEERVRMCRRGFGEDVNVAAAVGVGEEVEGSLDGFGGSDDGGPEGGNLPYIQKVAWPEFGQDIFEEFDCVEDLVCCGYGFGRILHSGEIAVEKVTRSFQLYHLVLLCVTAVYPWDAGVTCYPVTVW